MDRPGRGPVIWFLLCGLAVGCLAMVAEDASAVERPDGPGPYGVGYIDDTVTVETINDWDRIYPDDWWDSNPPGTKYTSRVRYFYPAVESGSGTAPDKAGAPYATIFIHVDKHRYRYDDIISHLVSHGIFVLIEVGVDPPLGTDFESVDHHRNREFRLRNLTEDETSVLYGLVDTDAMGVLAANESSTGATSSACYWPQFKAMIEVAPYSLAPDLFYWTQVLYGPPEVKDQYAMVMAGAREQETVNTAVTAYDAFTHFSEDGGAIVKVVLPDANDEGPWALDLIVSFVLFHLKGMEGYETFLYGEKMLEDVADERYMLEFQRSGHSEFPPDMSVEEPSGPVYMEDSTDLNITFGTYPELRNSTKLSVDWYINDNGSKVPWKKWSIYYRFPVPGVFKVAARWSLGDLYGWASPIHITVENKPPTADPGEDRIINMDEEIVFDGSNSTDTPSHRDGLLFKWSFPGDLETEFSNVSTYRMILATAGRFEATLTVRDPLGEETRSVCYVYVNNVVPAVTAKAKPEAQEDEVFSFVGTGSDSESHIGSLKYKWDFDDGSESIWAPTPEITHAYTDEGTYDAVLWIMDPLGSTGNATVQIIIVNIAPEGGIVQPMDGAELETDSRIDFIGRGEDTPSDILGLRYMWDFGDGKEASGAVVMHEYTEPGRYYVILTIEDDDGAVFVVNHTITVSEKRVEPVLDEPQVVLVLFGLVAIFGLAALATTEPGKYSIGLLSAPLFVRSKDVMDNKMRHALLGIITTNPGIHYSAIREEFGLANGQAAYHLDVLERESFIRSVRDGKMKRFYSMHGKMPDDVGRSPQEIRDDIAELIRGNPGITQRRVMEEMGLTRDAASYYLRNLVKEGRLVDSKEGKYTVYTVKGRR